ncbi:hypothetical protein HY732_00110 [Candidatus Uhrbacteria bacterium]|nr:hypothetical protein [Candidatus Uhrbacteria bacterium]
MDNARGISIMRGLLWAGITPLVVLIPAIAAWIFGSVFFSGHLLTAPFGTMLGFFSAIIILFPWEFADMILKTCKDLPPQCDTAAALFQLLFQSLALSLVFYACAGFLLGLLHQCVTVSTTKNNCVGISVTHKKIALTLCVLLCALIVLMIWGTVLNLQNLQMML